MNRLPAMYARGSPRLLPSHVPRAVWALTALFTLLLVFWSLLTPLDEAPDEVGHADLVFHLATGAHYPPWDGRHLGVAMLSASIDHRADIRSPLRARYLTPEAAPSRSARPDFDQAGGDRPTSIPNQMSQHPPLYYELGAAVLRVERFLWPGSGKPSLETEWHLVRLLNVLLLAPLCLLAWGAARRLGAEDGIAVAAAAVPLAIPQLLHVGSAINNDNLLTLLCGGLAVLLAGVARGDPRRSTAAAVGVLTALALLTKGFAFILGFWIVLAYAVPVWRDRARLATSAGRVAIAAGLAAALGGWWWLRHLLLEGSLSPSIADRLFRSGIRPPGFHPDLGFYAPRYAWWMAERFWGDFGYFTVRLSLAVLIAATAVAVGAAVSAFLPERRAERVEGGRRGPRPLELGVLASLFPMLVIFVAIHAYGLYTHSGKTPFIQGRYLFAALVPFAVVVAAGLHRLLGRWAALAALAAAAGMQMDAVAVVRRAWWAEPTASFGRSVRAWLAWLPWPPAVAWTVVIALFVAALVAAWELSRLARAPRAAMQAMPAHAP